MDVSDSYDVIILGAGSTGEVAAGRAHERGLSVVIVERELVGGECSYFACMPSKALLRPTAILEAAKRVPGAAEAVTGSVDVAAVLGKRNDVTSNWDDANQVKWLDSVEVPLVRGVGRITGEREVTVESDRGPQVLTANKAVIIATGSIATIPPIDGLLDAKPWTNREATAAKTVPASLLVIGGGYVAAELAQAWKRLGTETVTVLVRGNRLLDRAEPFAADAVQQGLIDAGIDIRFSTEATNVTRDGNKVTATLRDGTTIEAAEILVAAGRKPNTKDLGLDTVGLPDDQPIDVDDSLRSKTVPWLYAAGDVNGRALLTHMGKYQARNVADVIAGRTMPSWADNTAVPSVIFTDPQVASVGLTVAAAHDAGKNVREVKVDLSSAAGAYINGEDGTAQIVVDEDRKVIVGATFVGPEVGELLHAATIAVVGEVPIDTLWHAVPSYPTVSEVWLRLLEAYGL